MRYALLAILLVTAAVFTGCSDDDEMVMMPMTTANLTIDIDGLGSLGSGYAYEGWVIVDGQPVSTGTFQVVNGVPSTTEFAVDADQLAAATMFVLTIEPSPDSDPAPSATKYLGGAFTGDVAAISVDHPAALGDDFSMASGTYILNTPTTASDNTDYAAGIWWLDPGAGPGPTLDLPALPDGWVYEGWVAGSSGPITTGRFTMASGADSDGAGGSLAGNDPAPPFPGQDFINPLRTLTEGYAAVISIEPEPDDSPQPFALKPLVDMNIDDVGIGVAQMMSNQASTFPTGTVQR